MSIVSLQNGLNAYLGCEDTYVLNQAATTNYSTEIDLHVNNSSNDRGAFIKWDLSSLPSNITVTSATIDIYVILGLNQNINYLYKVNRNIDHSTATWNNYDTGLAWTTGGCQDTPDDRDNTALGEIESNPPSDAKYTITLNEAGRNVITDWITGASTNNGFTIQNFVDESTFTARYASSENATVENRPKLTIEYVISNTLISNALEVSSTSGGPKLTSPDGGEIFVGGDINIQWQEPANIATTNLLWYEIFITDDFDDYKKPDFLQIATIPSGNSSYTYDIHKNLKGEKCRVGIRTVNHEGIRSKMSFSSDNFSIINKILPTPSMVTPESNYTYFSYIPITFDNGSIIGMSSQRAYYQISYKSDSQDLDWALLRSNIMVGAEPFNIDVSGLTTSSDYSLKIELFDEDTVSSPVFIDNITINNINYFLIDTVPPKGSIQVQNNQEYIKDENIILSIGGYDDGTDVKEFRIEQYDVGAQEPVPDENLGQYADLTPLATWDVRSPDGVKLIQLRIKDYGDNVIVDDENAHYFRTYKNLGNREVTAFLFDGTDLYMAFASDSDNNAQLYKNLSFIATLDSDATAIEVYNSIPYIAIKDGENKGVLQRLSGTAVETVADNVLTTNSLYSTDSVINTMEVFDDTLFMGAENGELFSFTGSTVNVEHNTYINERSISKIKTNENVLYVYFENSTEIMIMSKTTSGSYSFTEIDTEN